MMRKILFALIICLMAIETAQACEANRAILRKLVGDKVSISESLSVASIEATELIEIEFEGQRKKQPFGNNYKNWLKFKSKMRLNDCIFYIESDAESWVKLSGRAGYVLVRNGKVVTVFYTSIS